MVDEVKRQASAGVGLEELRLRAQGGDPDASGEIFRRHRVALACALRRRGVADADVEDLLQQVLGRFLRNATRVRAPTSFLLTTAANVASSFNRRCGREREAMNEFARLRHAPVITGEARLISRLDLREALAAGGEKCRNLIREFVVRQVTYTEYAEATGTPRGTLGPAVGRCLRRARRYLESRGYPHMGRST